MLALITTLSSLLVCRFRSRAAFELEVVALRHQLAVLRRQQPGRPRLTSLDRLLWAWLYRVWPRCLESHGAGQISDRGPVASRGFPALLAVAFTRGTATIGSRGP
jgi:hypothetical protein